MRLFIALVTTSLAFACGGNPGEFSDGGDDQPASPGETLAVPFDRSDELDDFDVVLGEWIIEDGALKQTGAFAHPDYPRLIRRDLVFADLDLSVTCTALSGVIDQACGVMFHVVDSDNYLLVRSNALEDNIRLYHVKDGVRTETASTNVDVTANEPHVLGISTAGASVTVRWDDDIVLEGEDATFARGHVGIWTKADSVIEIDAFTATERE